MLDGTSLLLATIKLLIRTIKLTRLDNKTNMEDQLLTTYFRAGYKYSVILLLLAKFNGIFMSLRTLKRKFRRLGLQRRCLNIDDNVVEGIIQVSIDDEF